MFIAGVAYYNEAAAFVEEVFIDGGEIQMTEELYTFSYLMFLGAEAFGKWGDAMDAAGYETAADMGIG